MGYPSDAKGWTDYLQEGGVPLVVHDTLEDCTPEKGDVAISRTIYDAGTVSLIINGTACTASYGENYAPSYLASYLANAVNGTGAAPVTASVSGSTVYLARKADGNYSPGETIKALSVVALLGAAATTAAHILAETAPEWAPLLIP